VNFRIDAHLVEDGEITQRAKHFAGQYWFEVDGLFSPVRELHSESMGGLDGECSGFMDWV